MINHTDNNEPIDLDPQYENEEDNICPKCCGEGTNIKGQDCRTCEGTGTKIITIKKYEK